MGRSLKGQGSQKTCLGFLLFFLRATECRQQTKGQENWVQPFKPLQLEGFFYLVQFSGIVTKV